MLFLISYDKLNCRKIKQVSFKKYKCTFLSFHHYNDHQHNNFENRKGLLQKRVPLKLQLELAV